MQEAKETDRANVTNTAMIARSIQTRPLATFDAELVS